MTKLAVNKIWIGPELYLVGLKYPGHVEWWMHRYGQTGIFLKEGEPVSEANVASIAEAGIDAEMLEDAAKKLLMGKESLEINADGEYHIVRHYV